MSRFRINLIRDSVIPPARRRLIFSGIMLYLLICGLILVCISYLTGRCLSDIYDRQREISLFEREFRREHPGENDIVSYAHRMRNQLEKYAEKLEVIDGFLGEEIDIARLAVGISSPLPRGVYMMDMQMDARKASLGFDIVVPVAGGGNETTSATLISLWKKDATLMSSVEKIESLVSQRRQVSGRPMMYLRFAAPLTAQKE